MILLVIKMKVYYEVIFFLNFLLDFMILYGTKKVLKRSGSFFRLILSSVLGSFTTIFLFISISSISLFFLKLLFSIMMIFISFGYRDFFRNIFYFYLISIIVGGSIYLFDFDKYNINYFILLPIMCFFVISIFLYEMLQFREKYQNKYLVTIFYHNHKYSLEGFIDTGNRLISPYKRESIILVNLDLHPKNIIYVPYQALNCSGVIPCVRPDRVIINEVEFHHCLIGLSHHKFHLDGMNCILPNQFKEELC